jgi:hypothetical protein
MRFGNILDNVRRLHARGSTGRGMVVDHGGAMLGPDCVLVQRTAHGYQCVTRSEVATELEIVFGNDCRPDWLFDQCCRIAEALNDNQVALAQIYGVHAAPEDLDDQQVAKLAEVAVLAKANFNPEQPRIPKGEPDGGQWTADGAAADDNVTYVTSEDQDRKSLCIERCSYLLEWPLPYRWSNVNTFAFFRCVNDCMREMA